MRSLKVLFIETSDVSIASHLDGLIGHLSEDGLDVTIASNDSGLLEDVASRNDVRAYSVSMKRNPAPRSDLASVVQLVRLISRVRPKVVVYGTPKAALLGAIASWLVRVPIRVHVIHGLRIETMQGGVRAVYRSLDRLIDKLSTDVVAVGPGLAARAVEIGSVSRMPEVLGHGSAQGIDLDRFGERSLVCPDTAYHIGFVGRVTPDKGVDALVRAFAGLRAMGVPAQLSLAGTVENLAGLATDVRHILEHDKNIRLLGQVADVAAFMASVDVLCLPTRREGLPTVLMEAAALGLPIVSTRATGVADVVDDSTALLVDIDDSQALMLALKKVHDEPEAAKRRAERANELVRARFDRAVVWNHWSRYLRRLDGAIR